MKDLSHAVPTSTSQATTLIPLSNGIDNLNSQEDSWNDFVFAALNTFVPKVKCKQTNRPCRCAQASCSTYKTLEPRVEFRCTVRGYQQVFYRLFKDEQELHGKDNSSLILDSLKMQDFGSYRCEVRSDKRDDVRCMKSDMIELDVTPTEGKSELIYDCPESH